jgi:biopolymer transport protein ExbD
MDHALHQSDPPPIVEMNTTPLIDVLLVLLVMMIITLPLQTHAVKLDLPTCNTCPPATSVKNEVAITRTGQILWNGTRISEAELRYELAATRRMRPEPELHLRPDAHSRYEVVDRVLAIIKRAQVRKVGFVGNENYLNW